MCDVCYFFQAYHIPFSPILFQLFIDFLIYIQVSILQTYEYVYHYQSHGRCMQPITQDQKYCLLLKRLTFWQSRGTCHRELGSPWSMFAIADLALLALAEMKMFKALPAQRVYWILFILYGTYFGSVRWQCELRFRWHCRRWHR
jgi:hypothetical protein